MHREKLEHELHPLMGLGLQPIMLPRMEKFCRIYAVPLRGKQKLGGSIQTLTPSIVRTQDFFGRNGRQMLGFLNALYLYHLQGCSHGRRELNPRP